MLQGSEGPSQGVALATVITFIKSGLHSQRVRARGFSSDQSYCTCRGSRKAYDKYGTVTFDGGGHQVLPDDLLGSFLSVCGPCQLFRKWQILHRKHSVLSCRSHVRISYPGAAVFGLGNPVSYSTGGSFSLLQLVCGQGKAQPCHLWSRQSAATLQSVKMNPCIPAIPGLLEP